MDHCRFLPHEDTVAVANEIAGSDLTDWFHKALATTEELDYTEALTFYGLQFAQTTTPQTAFTLEPLPNATDAQKSHLHSILTGKPN